MKALTIILSASLIGATSIHAEDKGESKHTETAADGTSITTETSHSDSVGNSGVRKESYKVETVVDPKGMMNREHAKSQVEKVTEPDGDYSKKETIKHADGTTESLVVEKDTAKHWTDSGKTIKKTETHIVDPKGLGNKQKSQVTEETVVQPDGSSKRMVVERLNGEIISQKIIPAN